MKVSEWECYFSTLPEVELKKAEKALRQLSTSAPTVFKEFEGLSEIHFLISMERKTRADKEARK
jgi:hypothetical protein